jgi:hypothetical protein
MRYKRSPILRESHWMVTRYEQRTANYRAMVILACIVI